MQLRTLQGRRYWLYRPEGSPAPTPLPLLCWITGGEEGDIAPLCDLLCPAIADGIVRPFLLACVAIENWDNACSPWPAPPLSAKAPPFGGNGRETLDWLEGALLPTLHTEENAARGKAGILGYSLAGLFSLWALHESDAFDRCGCCSGSLWFDGFDAYLRARHPTTGCRIYLSLGDKEGKARNPRMAAVEPVTTAAYAQFQKDSAVAETAFVHNTGGHFRDISARLAHAALWLMK